MIYGSVMKPVHRRDARGYARSKAYQQADAKDPAKEERSFLLGRNNACRPDQGKLHPANSDTVNRASERAAGHFADKEGIMAG